MVLCPPTDEPQLEGREPTWNADNLVHACEYMEGERRGHFIELGNPELVSEDETPEEAQARKAEYQEQETFQKHLERWNCLADSVGFVAELGTLDGALVLNADLTIRGFGVRLTSTSGGEREFVKGEDGQPFQYKHLGTRHKSALMFAYDHPRTVVVVISEDGVLTQMIRPPEREPLLVWRPSGIGQCLTKWHPGGSHAGLEVIACGQWSRFTVR